MSYPNDDRYAPRGNETGTDFPRKSTADPKCIRCKGFGELHVPYEDFDTYLIHRCPCTIKDSCPKEIEKKFERRVEHHTQKQVAKAFAHAPALLRQLKKIGFERPRIELFEDASGCLILGYEGEFTNGQFQQACDLIHSQRVTGGDKGLVGINFCCGLVAAAES